MTASYTRDANDNPERPATNGAWYHRTEELPYILGEGTVRKMARELADSIISEARTVHGPVVWLTSNAYMPPIRSFPAAERVYNADNNRDGELLVWFGEMVENHLSAANVMMEAPDYDNALYAVDLNRWQYKEPQFSTPNFPSVPDDDSDDINDEWEPRDTLAVDKNSENPRE